MISHPSEWYENYTPGMDTTSRARYDNTDPVESTLGLDHRPTDAD